MFNSIIEQNRIKEILGNSIRHDQVSHAYLFTGARGIGKKAVAMAFAMALKCTAPVDNRPCGECLNCREFSHGNMMEFIHICPEEGQRTIKIRQIRNLIDILGTKTYDGQVRICLITSAETMTAEAQNALLKSLEEPIPGNVFLITTENGEKILPTIRSRCQVLSLEPLSDDGIRQLLSSKGYTLGNAEMERLLSECGGIPGKALNHVENNGEDGIKKEAFSAICDILKGNPMPIFPLAEKLGKNKSDSALLVDEWLISFENLFKAEIGGSEWINRGPWLSQVYPLLQPGSAQKIMEVLFEFSKNMQYNVNLRLQWESALLKIYEIQEKNR